MSPRPNVSPRPNRPDCTLEYLQQGETRNTQTRRYFKIIVFNEDIRVTQGKVDTPGMTSRPDEMEYKRQDLNTQGN